MHEGQEDLGAFATSIYEAAESRLGSSIGFLSIKEKVVQQTNIGSWKRRARQLRIEMYALYLAYRDPSYGTLGSSHNWGFYEQLIISKRGFVKQILEATAPHRHKPFARPPGRKWPNFG